MSGRGIPRGNTVALVGDPGTGKTTLLLTFLCYGDVKNGVVRLVGPNGPKSRPDLRPFDAFNNLMLCPARGDGDSSNVLRVFVSLESSFSRIVQHQKALLRPEGKRPYVVVDASAFLSGRLEDQLRFTHLVPEHQLSKDYEIRSLTLGGIGSDQPADLGLYYDVEGQGPVRIEKLEGKNKLFDERDDRPYLFELLTPSIPEPEKRIRLLKDLLGVIFGHTPWSRHDRLLGIDSLSALLSPIRRPRRLSEEPDGRRLHALNLVRWLEELDVTTLLATEATGPEGTLNGQRIFLGQDERYLVSGIIQLDYHRYRSGELVRYLRVLKMRGAQHDMRPHCYDLGPEGLEWIEPLFGGAEGDNGR